MNKFLLPIIVLVIAGTIIHLESQKARPIAGINSAGIATLSLVQSNPKKERLYSPGQEITTPDGFINTDADCRPDRGPICTPESGLYLSQLIGKKVILVDFWTYSCINCQRTTPYLNAWYEKYRDLGLEIVGIHTPEFDFEKEYNNVKQAVEKFGIQFPVVLDNDYSTWRSYKNRYWPRKYLIDIDGYIVYDHIGEGGYEETELKIQDALMERFERLGMNQQLDKMLKEPVSVGITNKESAASSPEVYFGSDRNELLANGKPNIPGLQTFLIPKDPQLNFLYFDGEWDVQPEFAKNVSTPARIIFRYRAQEVYMVASGERPIDIQILVDGQPVTTAAGTDVLNGRVTVADDRLYHLISDPKAAGEHTLELLINTPGLKAFTFTFG